MTAEPAVRDAIDDAQDRFHAAFREERRLWRLHTIAAQKLVEAKEAYGGLLKPEVTRRMAGGV